MEVANRSLQGGSREHVSICHVNLGFENNTDEIETIDPNSVYRNNYQENGVDAMEEVEDQSTLKADSIVTNNAAGIISVNDSSLKPSRTNIKKYSTPAVLVRNAVKCYGSGPKVLNNFSMTVQKGTIYSLLGSSGCGKTTLLSCVVGLKRITEGDIQVFGAKPGTKESGVPGKRVGYMPQELALYSDFSIQEILRYFGTIYGMKSSEIQTSINFLVGFLDLPNAERRIKTLSGGQKRRVSLAISLVHSPELLILDEPTVGVDPLLRESIWNHLCKLVSSQETTVIITTHYIEEARQSTTGYWVFYNLQIIKVGLMRGGRLLAEKSPEALLREHNTTLLEDIVLKLCRNDIVGNGSQDDAETNTNAICLQDVQPDSFGTVQPFTRRENSSVTYKGEQRISKEAQQKPDDSNDFFDSINRLRALVQKNYLVMTRNLLLMLFIILIPAVQTSIVCLAIGNDPKPMRMGMVNHETNYSEVCLRSKVNYDGGCDVENLSCRFLAKLPTDTIYLTEYESEKVARQAVKDGKVWGFMSFPKGYSDHVYTRASSGNVVDNATLEGSNIIFEMDLSNKQIALAMKKIFYDGYKDFVKELLLDCGFHPELGEIPLKYVEPIYGKDDTDFKEYVAPSVILGILFFFPLCSSSVSYIWDQKQGTLERALVAGVQTWEIMLAFFITEGVMIVVQVALTFLLMVSIFGIAILGSTALFLSLPFLMGFAGISMGFLIASFCTEEIEAVLLAMAWFFPNFLLSGMMWPTDGMPMALQYFSYLLPCTLACESIRSIASRGWGLTHVNVWPGFVMTFTWIAIYWTGTIIIHRVVRSKK